MIGFSQDKNLKESKLNFNKSNNYGSINKESNLIEDSKNNRSNICFNSRLIDILSETMNTNLNNKPFTLKKQEVHKHKETFVTEDNEAIQYLLEIKK